MEQFFNLQFGIVIFIIASIIMAFAGTSLVCLADKLTDLTKIGEALSTKNVGQLE